MVCPRCDATTARGTPCQLRTCKFAPKCHHHTQVRVGPSNIAGQGLFARTPIRAGTTIANYRLGTQELTRAQFLAKYANRRPTHVWAPRQSGPYYDGSDLRKSVAGAVNRAKNPNTRINANGKLVARRNIPAGRELTTAYGRGYNI